MSAKNVSALGCLAAFFLIPCWVCGPIFSGGRAEVSEPTPAPVSYTEQVQTPPQQTYQPPSTVEIDPYASNAPRQESAPQQQVEYTVYVTATGSKFHRGGCRYLRRSSYPMSYSQASSSYSPCSVCSP